MSIKTFFLHLLFIFPLTSCANADTILIQKWLLEAEGIFNSTKTEDGLSQTFSLIDSSIKKSIELNYQLGLGKAYLQKAILCYAQYQNAQPFIDSAIKYFEIIGDYKNLGRSYYQLIDIYWTYKHIDDIEKIILKTIQLSGKSKDLEVICLAKNKLTFVYTAGVKFEKAIANQLDAIQLAKELKNPDILANSYLNLSKMYTRLGMGKKAIEYLNKAVDISKSDPRPITEARILIQKAEVFLGYQNHAKTIQYYKEAIDKIAQTYYLNEELSTKYKLGVEYHRIKKFDLAEKIYEAIIKYNNLSSDTAGKATIYAYLFDGSFKTANYADAEKYGEFAYNYFLKTGNTNQLLNNLIKNLSVVKYKLGKPNEAYELLHKQYLLKDSVISVEKIAIIQNLESKYKSDKKEQELRELRYKYQNESLQLENRIYFLILIIVATVLISAVFISHNQRKKAVNDLKLIDTEQQLLRAQMNPHFIFNALNSIKLFVKENNSEKASDYLSEFSQLMRLILESSRTDFNTLEDEIAMLEYYLKLEQLRFQFQFTFSVLVSEEINDVKETMKIPVMLIQPFVENAIEHGIKHVKDGKIEVEFILVNDNSLSIRISDNGVGMKKSSETKNLSAHQPLALKIMQERIDLIQKKEGCQINIELKNLLNENETINTGTCVIVNIRNLPFK